MNIDERKKLLLKFGRCFMCIDRGHRAPDCQITVKCKSCKGFHNTCLCDAKLQQPRVGDGAQPTITSNPNSMLVGTESRIALQTAQASIKGRVQGRVRVLFDSGSHKSFITAKAAGDYGLEVVGK